MIFTAASTSAAPLVAGLGIEADTADGRALSAFADIGIAEQTWWSLAGATVRGGGALNLDTVYVETALEHSFDPVGVRVGTAYWGDKEILDSVDLHGALFARGKLGSLSAQIERRDFDFVAQSLLDPTAARTTEFQSIGLGLNGRLNTSDRLSLLIGSMSYSYSRDIRIPPRLENVRNFSTSRLSLMNSLLDYRGFVGIEWRHNLTSIDLRLEQWRTALDQGTVDSIAVGVLTPIGDRNDIELRLSYDESELYGSTVALSVFLFYFGGSP